MTVHEVLARLANVRQAKNGWTARCPAHEDNRASLSVSEGQDGRVLLHCHAGCTFQAICGALQVHPSELFRGDGNGAGREIIATYDYEDEDAKLLYQVVRFAPKEFRVRRPDGNGGWTWKLGNARRVLYRLPDLIEAVALAKLVHVVEGERDVHAVEAAGGIATTNPGGAGKWRPDYSETLRGARVRIVADRDESGRRHARQIAEALAGVAESVEIVQAREGKDAADHLAAGYTLEDFESVELGPEEPDDDGAADDTLLTDTRNAAHLVRLHGARLRYIPPWGRWIVWDNAAGRWIIDDRDVRVRELAKGVGRALQIAAAAESEDGAAKKMFAFARRSLNAHGISGMVDLARGIGAIPLDHEALDADGWLLGVENGVIDLRTGGLRPADPADLMTMQCPVKYDPAARAPRWERALVEWFPEPERRAYVHRVAGSALVGAQRDHVLILHYGTGGNGKGSFTRALQRVLGSYAVEIHLSLLVEAKWREHDTIRADLFRRRLAVAVETERRVRLAEASVKNLTGGDRIRARRMREDPWAFDPTHSLWLQTNHLPQISGRDHGIWRRIRVVRWESRFEGRAADPGLDDTLAAEARGILRWLVEGCLEWERHGLAEPEAVIRDTLEYRQKEDVFSRFASDTGLVFRPGLEIQAGELQRLLDDWGKSEGVEPPRQEIGEWLREHGGRKTQRRVTGPDGSHRRAKVWVGVGIEDDGHESEQIDALV